MKPEDFEALVGKWLDLAFLITAATWVAWFFGRIALGMIEVKK